MVEMSENQVAEIIEMSENQVAEIKEILDRIEDKLKQF